MIGASLLLAAVLGSVALGLFLFALPSNPSSPSLAHVIRATHSGPRRVYFCATRTKDYAAFVECLRNV